MSVTIGYKIFLVGIIVTIVMIDISFAQTKTLSYDGRSDLSLQIDTSGGNHGSNVHQSPQVGSHVHDRPKGDAGNGGSNDPDEDGGP